MCPFRRSDKGHGRAGLVAGPADISSGLLLVNLVAASQMCYQNHGMNVLIQPDYALFLWYPEPCLLRLHPGMHAPTGWTALEFAHFERDMFSSSCISCVHAVPAVIGHVNQYLQAPDSPQEEDNGQP